MKPGEGSQLPKLSDKDEDNIPSVISANPHTSYSEKREYIENTLTHHI